MNGTHDDPDRPPTEPTPTASAPQPPPAAQGAPYTPPAGAAPQAPPRVALPDPRTKSPALACCLSLMPGLGQVYVGYYQRGFVHVLVAAGIITLLASGQARGLEPLLGLFLAFFWLYNIIDAGRRASLYNQVLAGSESIDLPRDFAMPSAGGAVLGGTVLIVFGVVLLSNTLFDVSLEWVEDWWPVLPILLGVGLLVRAFRERSLEADQRDDTRA